MGVGDGHQLGLAQAELALLRWVTSRAWAMDRRWQSASAFGREQGPSAGESALSPLLVPPKCAHDFTVLDSSGAEVTLAAFQGKVLLVVNVAVDAHFNSRRGATSAGGCGMREQVFGEMHPGVER